MPLGSWFGGLATALSPGKEVGKDQPHTSDVILAELTYQMRIAEERELAAQREEKRIQMGGIDYSWLMTVKQKSYELQELERLELEELCSRVSTKEFSVVIKSFRDALIRERKASEMPGILRAIIHQILEARPQSGTSSGRPQWLSRSLSNLKSIHAGIRNNSISAMNDLCPDPEKQQHQQRSPSMELATMKSFVI